MLNKCISVTMPVMIVLMISTTILVRRCDSRGIHKHTTDDRRDEDVLELSWRTQLYAKKTGALPSSLSELAVDGMNVPVDPLTSAPYFYEILGHGLFRICTVFSSASDSYGTKDARYRDPIFGSWIHGKGRQCLVGGEENRQ